MPQSTLLSPPANERQTISANRIGNAQLGMTLGELKETMGAETQFESIPSFMVNLDAIAVSQQGEILYYILHWASEPLTDSDPIKLILTNNPEFRTAEGVGVGTPIEEAEAVYGEAKLNYHTANESREYVQFTNPPAPTLSFRPQSPDEDQFAGIYPDTQGEYHETSDYEDNATIGSIMLDGMRPQ
ncbi:MAG: hypothetical protein ACOC3E_02625 [Cyanobacteriota bacterium]